jgi:hypothetical protein
MAKDRPIIKDGDSDIAAGGYSGNRVLFGLARTINIGNYESIRVEYGESRVVQDGKSFQSIKKAVIKDVKAMFDSMVEVVEKEYGS